ncbi:hypothetical protein SprV_0401561700 [Sparganum proliferum]
MTSLQDTINDLNFYGRHVDDIFCLTDVTTDTDALVQKVNNAHPSQTFSAEFEADNEIAFLDVLLHRQEDGSIQHNSRRNQPDQRTALITRELVRYKGDIAVLRAARFFKQGQLEDVGVGYVFLWSGRPKTERRDASVSFAILNDIVERMPQDIDDRLMSLRLPPRRPNFPTIISAGSDEAETRFYEGLHALPTSTPKADKRNQPDQRTALITRELVRYKGDIAVLRAARFFKQGQLEDVGVGYVFLWSGRPKTERRDASVSFAILNDIVERMPQDIDDRLMSLRLPPRRPNFPTIISAGSDEAETRFYEGLHALPTSTPKADKLIALSDFRMRCLGKMA